jgi:CBS domain-containing protein
MKSHALATHTHRTTGTLPRHHDHEAVPLMDTDPAVTVMVDFANTCPLTVDPGRSIDTALQDMIGGGVRTLLVMTKGHVTGLITAYDIQGQKPLQFLRGSDCIHPNCRHQDIEVADIMIPLEALPTLKLADVLKARIGDILETFRETRQTHLLVTDRQDDQHTVVRGLISRTRIEQRLGISPILASAARTEQELSTFPRLAAQG